MNPQEVFCPNLACWARRHVGAGNIKVHSRKDRRYKCTECGRTFTETKGSIFYRVRTDNLIVTQVITLLAYGCPLPAIVQAFGFDERTIKAWWERAGMHCQAVHSHIIGSTQLDLQHVGVPLGG